MTSRSKRKTSKRSLDKCSEIVTKKIKTDLVIGTKSKYFSRANDITDGTTDCLGSTVEPTQTKRLSRKFMNQPCNTLATSLLGCTLVRKLDNGQELRGRIVETEAYVGVEDKAAHSYQGKRTNRNEAMFMEPGTLYVYSIYGMYHCINISSQGDGCAVLLRAVDPLSGLDAMLSNRQTHSRSKMPHKALKPHELCNGPSKLCLALNITKADLNQEDLCTSERIWLEEGDEIGNNAIISCPRINIGYAGDWVDKPLRFYIRDSKAVSVRNKKSEREQNIQ